MQERNWLEIDWPHVIFFRARSVVKKKINTLCAKDIAVDGDRGKPEKIGAGEVLEVGGGDRAGSKIAKVA